MTDAPIRNDTNSSRQHTVMEHSENGPTSTSPANEDSKAHTECDDDLIEFGAQLRTGVAPVNIVMEGNVSDNNTTDTALGSTVSGVENAIRDKCPVCLDSPGDGKDGSSVRTDTCAHVFCRDCLVEWAKESRTCPLDRIPFALIFLLDASGQDIIGNELPPELPNAHGTDDGAYFGTLGDGDTPCEVCGVSDNETELLLCDACDRGFHCQCLSPRVREIAWDRDWFCPECAREEDCDEFGFSRSSQEEADDAMVLGAADARGPIRHVGIAATRVSVQDGLRARRSGRIRSERRRRRADRAVRAERQGAMLTHLLAAHRDAVVTGRSRGDNDRRLEAVRSEILALRRNRERVFGSVSFLPTLRGTRRVRQGNAEHVALHPPASATAAMGRLGKTSNDDAHADDWKAYDRLRADVSGGTSRELSSGGSASAVARGDNGVGKDDGKMKLTAGGQRLKSSYNASGLAINVAAALLPQARSSFSGNGVSSPSPSPNRELPRSRTSIGGVAPSPERQLSAPIAAQRQLSFSSSAQPKLSVHPGGEPTHYLLRPQSLPGGAVGPQPNHDALLARLTGGSRAQPAVIAIPPPVVESAVVLGTAPILSDGNNASSWVKQVPDASSSSLHALEVAPSPPLVLNAMPLTGNMARVGMDQNNNNSPNTATNNNNDGESSVEIATEDWVFGLPDVPSDPKYHVVWQAAHDAVKKHLRPFVSKDKISRTEYSDIIRRATLKVCAAYEKRRLQLGCDASDRKIESLLRSSIDDGRIESLVREYIRIAKHSRRKASAVRVEG